MARPVTSPSARLRLLTASLAKAKALKRGTVLNAKPMCELLGVSWPVLREWCDDLPGFAESGAFTAGGNGIEWTFKPVATVNFLIRHFEGVKKAQIATAQQVRRAIAGDGLADAPAEMSLDEIAKALKVAAAMREERERQGQLIEVAKVATLADGMITRLQQAAIQAGREYDPTGQWPVEYSEMWQRAIENVALAAGQAGAGFLSGLNGGDARPGAT